MSVVSVEDHVGVASVKGEVMWVCSVQRKVKWVWLVKQLILFCSY